MGLLCLEQDGLDRLRGGGGGDWGFQVLCWDRAVKLVTVDLNGTELNRTELAAVPVTAGKLY